MKLNRRGTAALTVLGMLTVLYLIGSDGPPKPTAAASAAVVSPSVASSPPKSEAEKTDEQAIQVVRQLAVLQDAFKYLGNCHKRTECVSEQLRFTNSYIRAFSGDIQAMAIVSGYFIARGSSVVVYDPERSCVWSILASTFPSTEPNLDTLRKSSNAGCVAVNELVAPVPAVLTQALTYHTILTDHPITSPSTLTARNFRDAASLFAVKK